MSEADEPECEQKLSGGKGKLITFSTFHPGRHADTPDSIKQPPPPTPLFSALSFEQTLHNR